MGPSGSGKSTLMHILAALDLPSSGYVTIADTQLGELSDTEITKLRREHIGFVFQFFNLLPMLSAEENILLPLSIAGREARQGRFEELLEEGRPRRPAQASSRRSSPADSSSEWRSRAPSSPSRRWSSPTSPPATSTRRRAARSSSSCATPSTTYGQTIVMVTHDGARGGDRRPGALPRRRPHRPRPGPRRRAGDRRDDPASHPELIRVSLRGLAGRKLRAALTAVAIVLGVAMISGTYVLTDSIDQAFSSIFTDVRKGFERRHHRKAAFHLSDQSGTTAPPFDESLLSKVRALPDVAAAEPRRERRGAVDRKKRQGDRLRRCAEPRLQHRERRFPFNPLTLVDGAWPGPGEVVVDQSTADKEHLKIGQEIGVQAEGPSQRLRISGLVKFGSVATIGGATLAGFDLATAQRLFNKPGKLDEIAVASRSGVSDAELMRQIRAILPPETQVPIGATAGGRGCEWTRMRSSAFLQKFLLAFCRHRALRRQLRDRQLALDHDRAANARARHDADARRLASAGAGARSSSRRSSSGALASVTGLFLGLGARASSSSGSSTSGASRCRTAASSSRRGRSLLPCSSALSSRLRASLRPALRATRVPPIGAVREGATLPESRFARFRTPGSLAADRDRVRLAPVRALRTWPRHRAVAPLDGRRCPVDLPRHRAFLRACRASVGGGG